MCTAGKPHSQSRAFADRVLLPSPSPPLSPVCACAFCPGQNRYCFWYYRKGAQKESRDPSEAYESGIKVVESFQTVEHFWRIYNHILRADQVNLVIGFVLCWLVLGWVGGGVVCVVVSFVCFVLFVCLCLPVLSVC